MWRKRELHWSDVADVSVKTVSSYAAYGLIKTGSSSSLVIAVNGGLFGTKKLNLANSLLTLDSAGLPGLVDQLERARAGAPVMARSAPARAAARSTPFRDPLEGVPRSDDFDPDAALARYLARRDHAPSVEPQVPARPVFGRKMA
jgi:hypothetical protein